MKKTSILLAAVLAVSILLISWVATSGNAAIVITETDCSLLDGDGAPVYSNDIHGVLTSAGTLMLTCCAQVPNSSGKAIIYKDIAVNTVVGPGTCQEIISASGQATLTCWAKAQ
jgi:hypothetical protein